MKLRILAVNALVAAVALGACAYPVYQDRYAYRGPAAYSPTYHAPRWRGDWGRSEGHRWRTRDRDQRGWYR